jgi:hypothetical protein
MEALAKIGDDNLTRSYIAVISNAEKPLTDEFEHWRVIVEPESNFFLLRVTSLRQR